MSKKCINIALLYPCDPSSPLIGGIESFINGVILNAPDRIHYYVIGATTDSQLRPIGQWSTCQIENKYFQFFPLYLVRNKGKRPFFPATIQYELSALLLMPDLSFTNVIESHRIEHLIFRSKNKPFNLFLHQNMAILNNPKSDILWKRIPKLYRSLEKFLFKRSGNIFCVREDAVKEYKRIFPDLSEKFHFQPTWMNEDFFYPILPDLLTGYRMKLCEDYKLDVLKPLAVAVGRIDSQKDPILMADAVAAARQQGKIVQVIWIGDGILKESFEKKINELGLAAQFKLAGLRGPAYVANAIRVSNFFLMSSAYEGMPIAVLEALACGCPVVSTNVGEVSRLVQQGKNGFLAEAGNINSLTQAIINMINAGTTCNGKPCLDVANQYRATNVLKQVYDSYN